MSRLVAINSERVTEIDGQLFFPIAARHMPVGANFQILAEAGFNAVRWTPFGVDKAEGHSLTPPDDLGKLLFYAYVFDRGDLAVNAQQRERELTRLVEAVREHPNLLAYEQRNEPAGMYRNPSIPQSTAAGLIAGSRIIRRLDPNHPICIGYSCGNLVATLRRYNPAVDIIGCNPYVVLPPGARQFVGLRSDGKYVDSPDQTLSAVGLHTEKMMRVAEGRAIWMQVQGASNENWYSELHTPENAGLGLYEYQRLYPNRWQMRFMAWDAIIRGATGLTWMLYGLPVDSLAWSEVVAVVRELRSLEDALVSSTWQGRLQIDYEELGFSDWDGVQTLVKQRGNETYIFAANTQFDPMIGTFSGLPGNLGTELEVVGETRRLPVDGEKFKDRFQPYEVHLYKTVSPRDKSRNESS
jgi:hypothetical protein